MILRHRSLHLATALDQVGGLANRVVSLWNVRFRQGADMGQCL